MLILTIIVLVFLIMKTQSAPPPLHPFGRVWILLPGILVESLTTLTGGF